MKLLSIFFTLCLSVGFISITPLEAAEIEKATKQLRIPVSIYSKFDVTVSGEIKGKISDVVNVGDKVIKGQVLAILEQDYEHQIKQHYQTQAITINKQIQLLDSQVKRYAVLANKSSVSQEQNESKQLALLRLEQQLNELNIRISEVDYAIERKTLRAEFDGTVYQRFVNIGEAVSAQSSLLKLLADKSLYVKAQVPQAMIRRIDKNNATFAVNDLEPVPLVFDYLGAVVNPNSNTVEVSFEITNWQQFMPGQKGHMTLNYKSQ